MLGGIQMENNPSEKKRNEAFVSLCILGQECDPSDLTEILGTEPTVTRRKGDLIYYAGSPTKLVYKCNVWEMESSCDPKVAFEEQIDVLLDKVLPFSDRFKALPADIDIMLNIALYFHEYKAYFLLTAKQVQGIAKLGARLDVDIYDFSE